MLIWPGTMQMAWLLSFHRFQFWKIFVSIHFSSCMTRLDLPRKKLWGLKWDQKIPSLLIVAYWTCIYTQLNAHMYPRWLQTTKKKYSCQGTAQSNLSRGDIVWVKRKRQDRSKGITGSSLVFDSRRLCMAVLVKWITWSSVCKKKIWWDTRAFKELKKCSFHPWFRSTPLRPEKAIWDTPNGVFSHHFLLSMSWLV